MRNRVQRLLFPLFLVTIICARSPVFCQSTLDRPEESSTLTYHSKVSEVRLVFFAKDEHNRSVEELQQSDFAVVDDESVIRDFRSFTRADLIKLDLIVLIDSSESVGPHFEEEIADVQHMISQWPWNPSDHLSVLSFSGIEAHLVCAGNCHNSFTADRLASLPRGGATPLFDALDVAANLLMQRRQPDVWPVIILFSDGDDTISKASLNQVSAKILASEAQIYAVDLGNPGRPSNGTATLQRLAEDSGGRHLQISEGAVAIINHAIDDLHSARIVTYLPPASASGFHSTRVLPTRNLKLHFRTRRGYYYHSNIALTHSEDIP
jgi:VWFA-related protein